MNKQLEKAIEALDEAMEILEENLDVSPRPHLEHGLNCAIGMINEYRKEYPTMDKTENGKIGAGMLELANAELLAAISPPCEPKNQWICGCQDLLSDKKPVAKYYGQTPAEAIVKAIEGMIPEVPEPEGKKRLV